jgi:hypothetical protein
MKTLFNFSSVENKAKSLDNFSGFSLDPRQMQSVKGGTQPVLPGGTTPPPPPPGI